MVKKFVQSRTPARLLELNAVATIAAHGNFRLAAVELGMSPSALSHAVASLEQRMGVRLLHRTTRSVRLSEAGERFLARVTPALRAISEAMDDVHALSDTPRGTLRINTSEGALRRFFEPVVLRFLELYPEVDVHIVSEGRLVDIVAEGFDAGVRLADYVPRDMVAVPFGPRLRFAVVGSPRYFETRGVPKTPAELLAHECIRGRLPSGAPFRWEFERRGQELVVDVTGRLMVDETDAMVAAALAGAGLAYVTEWAVEAALRERRLVRVLEEWTPPYPGLAFYYPSHRHPSAALRAFLDVVRATKPAWSREGQAVTKSASRRTLKSKHVTRRKG